MPEFPVRPFYMRALWILALTAAVGWMAAALGGCAVAKPHAHPPPVPLRSWGVKYCGELTAVWVQMPDGTIKRFDNQYWPPDEILDSVNDWIHSGPLDLIKIPCPLGT